MAAPRNAPKNAKRAPARTAATEEVDVAALCHALSDPTRLAILDRLRSGEQCVCNLVDVIGGGQSRLSFHLKTLREAGLVTDRREGRWVHYSLSPKAFEVLHAFVASLERCCPGGTKKGGSCC